MGEVKDLNNGRRQQRLNDFVPRLRKEKTGISMCVNDAWSSQKQIWFCLYFQFVWTVGCEGLESKVIGPSPGVDLSVYKCNTLMAIDVNRRSW